MKQKTIAVDIDDVLAANAPAFLTYSNEKWGTRLTIDDFDENWASMWAIDHATVIKRSEEIIADKLFSTFSHFDDAHPVLEKLAKTYKLVIATSRKKVLAADTLEWINQYFPGIFSEIHHAGIWDDDTKREHAHLKTKADLVKQIGADYLIDDQPKHCQAADEAGIQTILFGDYPWNRKVSLPASVVRTHSWADVEEYFDGQ